MNRALYIGATSMIANQKRMDVLTNNLANVNTAGYKKDFSVHESFPEKLLAKRSRLSERVGQRQSAFQMSRKGEAYVASVKEGYFVMQTPRGKSYVKDIEVIPDAEGYLKTHYRMDTDDNPVKTDYENYLLDKSGNRIRVDGDMEETLRQAVYHPASFIVGTMSRGVRFQKTVTDFSNGGVEETGGTFDLALSGDGFFKVMDPQTQEVYYTRNGSFEYSNGYLKDMEGRLVMADGEPLELDGTEGLPQISVASDGTLTAGEETLGKLDIVRIANRELLRKVGENRFAPAKGATAEEQPFEGRVLQGYLETSNVNAVDSIVEMIQLQRDYDTNQRMVRTVDEMLQKSSTELGRV